MHRVVAVGEIDFVRAFRAGGVEAFAVANADEAASQLTHVCLDPTVALVLTSERTAAEAADAVASLRERSKAVLLVLPSHTGAQGDSMAEIKKQMEKALGVDLLSKI
jgi:V/A-type H+-transporting ATPase subunit F